MVMSVTAVVVLTYLGLLCVSNSDMVELPASQKADAGTGCFGAALLYVITFFAVGSYRSTLKNEASAREVAKVAGRN